MNFIDGELREIAQGYGIVDAGPLGLLKETRANHLGKLAFRWMYWNLLLPGRPLPVPTHMSMVGKTHPHQEA